MGPPLRGRGLFVLDRNEGVVSPFGSGSLVSSWLALTPLSAASQRALSLLLPAGVLYLGWWLGLCPAAAGALLPDGPHCSCGSWEVLGSLHCAPLAVGLLPGPPSLLCLLSAGCFGLAAFSFR